MQKFDIRNIFDLHGRKALMIVGLFALFSFAPQRASAQLNYMEYVNKKIYFGITLGFNISKYKYTFSDKWALNENGLSDTITGVTATSGPGFNLGIVTNLKLGKYFDLRFIPALSFAGKGLDYQFNRGITAGGQDSTISKSIESIAIEFPLMVRFKSQPIKDIRFYVLVGMKYSIDMASNAKARLAEDQVKVSRSDLSYELGFGIQFFFPLFIFSPEFKVSNGFYSVHSKNNGLIYSNSLEKLYSRSFVFSLHFEG